MSARDPVPMQRKGCSSPRVGCGFFDGREYRFSGCFSDASL
ncbi:hypothetical protein HMPREF1508_0061 [Shuttleworthella sp. MSX8B]|nr:hypothetical protein HMPREF1508_0061 [Shuttleworthia sp. MSX8B]